MTSVLAGGLTTRLFDILRTVGETESKKPPAQARSAQPEDRLAINQLLQDTLGLPSEATALDEKFQQWKYWDAHPWHPEPKSRILERNRTLTAHVGLWPLRLRTMDATYSAFQPIDWAARRTSPGAGLNLLRSCYAGNDAAISVGGSEMTQKILPATGFKPQNAITLFRRPLHRWQPAWRESPRDWKLPARIARNFWQHSRKAIALDPPWNYTEIAPEELPSHLWPQAELPHEVVSVRSPALLRHFERCPEISRAVCFALRKQTATLAYFFLVQVQREVRLADYGPAALNEETSWQLGIAAQAAARQHFPQAHSLLALTSETLSVGAWARSGLVPIATEPIRVLKLNAKLNEITQFRLTLLDWDLLCL